MLADHVGNSLNSRKDRFDKATVLEVGIDVYSKQRIKWVDATHHDHELNLSGNCYRIEMKFGEALLSTRKRGAMRKTVSVRLSNVLGEHSKARERRFNREFGDLLLLVDHQRVAVLPRKVVLGNLKFAKDYVELKLDGAIVESYVLVNSSPASRDRPRTKCRFGEQKMRLIRTLVKSIR
jgi:hypothetical protein